MNRLKQIAFIFVLALSLTTFAACGKNNRDMNSGTENGNPAVTENETAGDHMDNAGENMKDAAEDTGDAIRDTGEAIRDGMTGDTD